MIGNEIYSLCKKLFPLNRSLTGDGNRQTLNILKKYYKNLSIKEIKSGTKVYDWKIPLEWNVKEAWIKTPNGNKIADFKKNNLHLVGYSHRVKKTLNFKNLKKKLNYLKNQPNAIPYVTSYYKKNWGFCISFNEFKKLKKNGTYEINIDSKFKKGSLTYGEILIPGRSKKEVFLSTYICHPSMANNELSGPAVTIFLAKWIAKKKRKYSYRIIFIPETIGSISYLSKNKNKLKKNVVAGFNITCVGDNRSYSYLPSRNGDTLSDRVGLYVLKNISKNYKKYSWLERGGDERQYCSPGVDLPVATIMRTKYATYKEYHTSLDNLNTVVSSKGLNGGFNLIKKAIETIEKNVYFISKFYGEPQMSKRNLYPSLSKKNIYKDTRLIMNVLSYCDGKHSIIDLSEKLSKSPIEIKKIIKKLIKKKIIKQINEFQNYEI
tara:strand:- start:1509 stop:2810 length:1302 start_codon:yes stop_codon:yes gene_type:complete